MNAVYHLCVQELTIASVTDTLWTLAGPLLSNLVRGRHKVLLMLCSGVFTSLSKETRLFEHYP